LFLLQKANLARESHSDRQVVNFIGVTAMRLLKSMMIMMVFTGLFGFGLSAVILT
jgi:lipopolysaccharide export LptBFGC system permease protein LptF